MKLIKIFALGVALIALPFSAAAALVSAAPPTCSVSNLTPPALACSGAWAGNNLNQEADVLAEFNALLAGTWIFEVSANVGFSDGAFNSVPGANSGTISFDTPQTGVLGIVLKAGDSFSLYVVNAGGGLSSVNFVTNGVSLNPGNGTPNALSHASLYRFDGVCTQCGQEAPEPGTYGLLGAGLIAMGLLRRRMRRSS